MLTAVWLLVPASYSSAQSPREQLVFFTRQVKPLLVKHCFKCHGGKKVKGGL